MPKFTESDYSVRKSSRRISPDYRNTLTFRRQVIKENKCSFLFYRVRKKPPAAEKHSSIKELCST
jgi:hypothetical protein